MVSVVQLVERQIVVLVVVGSSPTVHPNFLRTGLYGWSFFVDNVNLVIFGLVRDCY